MVRSKPNGQSVHGVRTQSRFILSLFIGIVCALSNTQAQAPEITNFPYLEDFESGDGGWTATQEVGSTAFELGDPSKAYLNSAASGSNAWVTGLSSDFSSNSRSQVTSPVFDLRNVPLVEVSLNVAWESAPQRDGAQLQVSQDGGANWSIVGAAGEPNNWYNNSGHTGLAFAGQSAGWSGYYTSGTSPMAYQSSGGGGYSSSGTLGSGGFVPAKHFVQGGEKTLFRIQFGADAVGQDEGFAFDDFGVSAAASVSQTAAFLNDANNDGYGDPGDTIRFTAVISNDSSTNFTNVSFTDLLSDSNLALIVGSVSTDIGTVGTGNSVGNTAVAVNIGTLNALSTATITFDVTIGALSPSVTQVCAQGTVNTDQFDADTDDSNTAAPVDPACVSAFASSDLLNYNLDTFTEADANDGSIETVVEVTLSNDSFAVTNGVMTAGQHYQASNVPSGLALVVTGTSATSATFTLTGNAAAHESANNVSNLTITFLDDAFTNRPASKITNASKSDFAVEFADASTPTPTPTATPTPSVTPTPSATPSPSATPTASATPVPGPTVSDGNVTGSILNSQGSPVPGVLVYLTVTNGKTKKMFSTITDASGRYQFAEAGAGAYLVEPDYTGLSFSPSSLSLASGDVVPTIVASAVNLNSEACELTDFGSAIERADDRALALLNFGVRKAKRFSVRARKAGNGQLLTDLASVKRRLQSSYNQLVQTSQELPKLTLSCGNKAGCTSNPAARKISRYREHLRALRSSNFDVVDSVRAAFGANAVATLPAVIVNLHEAAVAATRKLPRSTDVCTQ